MLISPIRSGQSSGCRVVGSRPEKSRKCWTVARIDMHITKEGGSLASLLRSAVKPHTVRKIIWVCDSTNQATLPWPLRERGHRPLRLHVGSSGTKAWMNGRRAPGYYVASFNCCCWSLLYSAVLRSRMRSHAILHEWLAFYSVFLNSHRSGVLTALAWLVPRETAAISARSLYTIQPYTMSLHAKPHT